jgi:hypothetical protein
MINSVEITNYLEETITMDLRFPEQSGFLIQSIDGLNPGKANINVEEISGSDGSLYNSSRVNTRNILFSFIFKKYGITSIEDLRQKSYKYFPIKRQIKIVIETDNRVCETYGYVESNEINIFSSNEGSIISIICPDPYLYAPDVQITTFGSSESVFELPFSNESASEKLIEFGSINFTDIKTIYYLGDAPVGIIMSLHFTGEATNIEIMDAETFETMFIDTVKLETLTGDPISAGDEIVISTVKGNKYAILIRDGNTTNIINALGTSPTWFEIDKGDNLFSFSADTGGEFIQFEITNKIAYEGV